jgi:antitoxin component YwqK of YwqJK toxin-antitoxin module
MKRIWVLLLIAINVASCKEQKKAVVYNQKKIDQAFVDSIIKNSDTTYSKPYKRPDFVTAEYYISKKDSTEAQIMRDSAKQIRQVLVSKKGVRNYYALYYPNGQLQADLKFDNYGQFDGPAAYYYESGAVKSAGNYKHGLSTGEWKEYDEGGAVSIVKYDANGVRITGK